VARVVKTFNPLAPTVAIRVQL